MKQTPPQNILVVRMRQMGDAIVSTTLLASLRATFPQARIHFVLNERIAPLFEGHPAIDRIIAIPDSERHSAWRWLRRVRRTVSDTRYDVIIDMRSTLNTLMFPLLSPGTRFRIGTRKPYSRLMLTHRIEGCGPAESMVDHDLAYIKPLAAVAPEGLKLQRRPSLGITAEEIAAFRQYMQDAGVDFSRPIMLAGVTAKLDSKIWPRERMQEVLRRFSREFPDVQILFNYAPGKEEAEAKAMALALNADASSDEKPQHAVDATQPPLRTDIVARPLRTDIVERPFHTDIVARSPRQLAAMAANITLYFGNEGGARHIVQAMGCPSYVVCSPFAPKAVWLPQDDPFSKGIAPSDVISAEALTTMSPADQYAAISVDRVWDELKRFASPLLKNFR